MNPFLKSVLRAGVQALAETGGKAVKAAAESVLDDADRVLEGAKAKTKKARERVREVKVSPIPDPDEDDEPFDVTDRPRGRPRPGFRDE